VDDGFCLTRASEIGNTCVVLLSANEHGIAKRIEPGAHGILSTIERDAGKRRLLRPRPVRRRRHRIGRRRWRECPGMSRKTRCPRKLS
jgi:hypothetical protein